MNAVVLAGGLSPERDVSLSSGCLIANALIKNGHAAVLLDLYTGMEDSSCFGEALEKHGAGNYTYTIPPEEPDLEKLKTRCGGREEWIGPNVIEICKTADAVFLALHGAMGENGQIQAVFDTYNISYTGTGYTGSLLAMDKGISKELMSFHKIKTPDWILHYGKTPPPVPFLPCVIKPVHCGSSIGVSIVETAGEFAAALSYAGKYEDTLLFERKIDGREFTVGILDGRALPVIEIIPRSGFFDYRNKYQQGMTSEICPADIDTSLSRELQDTASAVHRILRLGSYSRIDFIVDKTGTVHCLEANTLPGMTPASLLPQASAAAGISYEALCERILNLALGNKN
ncbi:D-alanine--D-alanine ligase family protein [Breznakiella homolactica]|uniref:D-alanine--D-alanine ligase n=1 Tax=Breznakiella homolactica TaxID=2798577 RepID=A0A7T8B914_9SPIR|nr:D-alanine--D-alanine ligase [Breznakiella homolactica]QQO09169.1 D-alanine--D-alanine ligase [Breznakiella homolactica]